MTGKTYRIGQAAEALGLKPYVLRYWESEFPQIKPLRTDKGQRLYTEENLEIIRNIQALLHDEGLTIEGARKRLDEDKRVKGLKDMVRGELDEMRRILED